MKVLISYLRSGRLNINKRAIECNYTHSIKLNIYEREICVLDIPEDLDVHEEYVDILSSSKVYNGTSPLMSVRVTKLLDGCTLGTIYIYLHALFVISITIIY